MPGDRLKPPIGLKAPRMEDQEITFGQSIWEGRALKHCNGARRGTGT